MSKPVIILVTAGGMLATWSLVSPESLVGWLVVAFFVAGQGSWALERLRGYGRTEDVA